VLIHLPDSAEHIIQQAETGDVARRNRFRQRYNLRR
jgi:hypothetical protein